MEKELKGQKGLKRLKRQKDQKTKDVYLKTGYHFACLTTHLLA